MTATRLAQLLAAGRTGAEHAGIPAGDLLVLSDDGWAFRDPKVVLPDRHVEQSYREVRRRVADSGDAASFVAGAEPAVRALLDPPADSELAKVSDQGRWRRAVLVADAALHAVDDDDRFPMPTRVAVVRLAALVFLAAPSPDGTSDWFAARRAEVTVRWLDLLTVRRDLGALVAYSSQRVGEDLEYVAGLDAAGPTGAADVADLHLLGSYQVLRAVAVIARHRARLLIPTALFVAGAAAALVVLVVSGPDAVSRASWYAGAGYAAAVVAALSVGWRSASDARRAFVPALLRIPATSLVGVFALMAAPGWVDAGPPVVLCVVVLAAALALVTVECVEHADDGPWPVAPLVLGRAVVVWLYGVVHGFAVAVIAAGAAGEAFFGDEWAEVLRDDGRFAAALALLGGGGFLAGMVLQTFWEQTPITSPVSRTSWRGR